MVIRWDAFDRTAHKTETLAFVRGIFGVIIIVFIFCLFKGPLHFAFGVPCVIFLLLC